MLSPTPDSLSGGYAPSEPVRPKSQLTVNVGAGSGPEPTSLGPAVAGAFPVLRGRRYTTSTDVTQGRPFVPGAGEEFCASV
jgi:hypothetical protein